MKKIGKILLVMGCVIGIAMQKQVSQMACLFLI